MSSRFSRDDVENIARLARLALTDVELDGFARQLADVLAYAEHVQEVDTNGVPPTFHPLATTAPLRGDSLQRSLPVREVVAAAPDGDPDAGLFKVPRVLG
ncbi:MAG: Asp-tRNA(Asn)/Glu-tRNA(Gln) amidotransferase subunit GatC [Acidobacteria bacterium]|nr:Asp-tRNA(Asn)/Glu-tRNA(Gln) amidotransferase subunit GatC [Acidobacteriota bacterium]MCA1650348.1 Asp-tRNA(Asn)/Glu-tRNA(Gln) amidotransferase subunit GatC [Acidobacteriota bacterium]